MDATQVRSATKLHKISLKQAIKAAKACGWSDDTIKEVANLDWTEKGLERLIKQCKATKQQASRIKDVRDAAKFEMLGNFALSQLS